MTHNPTKTKIVTQGRKRSEVKRPANRRRETAHLRSEDIAVLARTKFEGYPRDIGRVPLRKFLGRPPVLRNVDLDWFYAAVEGLLSYDDEQFCAADPDRECDKAILEFGTACHHVAEWHRDIAKVYDSLLARIAVLAARREGEAQAAQTRAQGVTNRSG